MEMHSKRVKLLLLKILFSFPSLNCPMSSCIRQLWVVDEEISPSLEERLEKRSRKDRGISPRFLPFSPSSSNNSTLLSESSGFQKAGLTRIQWLLFYSRSTADQLEAWSIETRAVCEAGRDLKSFLTPVKNRICGQIDLKTFEPLHRKYDRSATVDQLECLI